MSILLNGHEMQFLARPSVTEDLFPGSSVNLTDDPFFSFKPTVGSLLLFPRLASLPFVPWEREFDRKADRMTNSGQPDSI